MKKQLVSCIMPTANRFKYITYAIDYFLNQDYPETELIIIDDGKESMQFLIPNYSNVKYFYTYSLGKIGNKRNYACHMASGNIIMHWDDDDWHAVNWISKQVEFLINSEADITGIEHVNFYSPIADTYWIGTSLNRNNPYNPQPWLNGATLAYRRSFWQKHQFENLQEGEDDAFIKKSNAKIFAHDYIDGFVALLHPYNTTVKYFEKASHKAQDRL